MFSALAEEARDDATPPPLPKATTSPAPQPKPPPGPVATTTHKAPPEPWYYKFLEGFAGVVMALGLFVCAGAFLIGFLLFVGAASSGGSGGSFALGLGVMLYAVTSIIPVLLATAPALLAVDAARNIRAMRYER